jgi:hypothetical protein
MSDYDPVARREYYLRTRELKGREKAKEEPKAKSVDSGKPKVQLGPKLLGKTDPEKEKKSTGSAANKAKSDRNWANAQVRKEISQKQQKDVANIRALATLKRTEVTNKFKAIMTKLTTESEQKGKELTKERDAKLAKVAADRKAKLAAIPDIPDNVSPEVYEALRLRRIKKIRKVTGDASKEEGRIKAEYSDKQGKASKEANTKKAFVRAVTNSQKDELQSQLEKSLDDARNRYETLKGSLGPKE